MVNKFSICFCIKIKKPIVPDIGIYIISKNAIIIRAKYDIGACAFSTFHQLLNRIRGDIIISVHKPYILTMCSIKTGIASDRHTLVLFMDDINTLIFGRPRIAFCWTFIRRAIIYKKHFNIFVSLRH